MGQENLLGTVTEVADPVEQAVLIRMSGKPRKTDYFRSHIIMAAVDSHGLVALGNLPAEGAIGLISNKNNGGFFIGYIPP